ncbi:hypothetical protein Anas_02406 [Armadillidium nasatum]|uniref:Uncharacterized protein n=1 Tax=Armadillidium nasatum TaxID=96803 RepID=A0A5N5SWU2_9CRUS|nr:hypothetical protein Anas_02406 [Armadillidium nasatum]
MRWLKSYWCWWSAAMLLFTIYMSSPSSAEVSEELKIFGDFAPEESLTFNSDEMKFLSILGSLIGLSVSEITSILSIAKLGLGVVDILENIFLKVFNGTAIDLNFPELPGTDRKLLAMFEIITLRLEQIQRGVEGTETSLLSLTRGLPHMVRWEIALDTLEGYMKPINNLYHRFSYYQKHKMSVENHTLLDFAESVTSHSTVSIQALMANIHSMIAPSDPPLIRNYDDCHYHQSPQQLVFGMYTLLALTLARGYSMINFSYQILKYHNAGNFTVELRFIEELYKHYSKGIYIENEVDLNKKGTCGSTCKSYQHAVVEGCYLPDDQYCGKHRRCKGKVHDCTDAEVCISELPYRRYDWIRYGSHKFLGRKSFCDNEMNVDSWWRFLYHCSYCVCLCDDAHSPTSDRFISLKPVVSDIVNGRKNRVVHLQVQQGAAMPQGQVDPNTLEWVEVEPITVDSDKYKDGIDYFTFKYEARSMDLDKLIAPKGHVITGVKFRTLGAHINLEVWVTPINFTSATLSPKMSYWISNDNTPIMVKNPRKELKLREPDDPRYSKTPSEIDSHSDMFVQFQQTSMDMDVSQLTVPFLDAQPVSPSPATWLEGLQIYHRGRDGYGGFIGLQVFNFNLKNHFDNSNLEAQVIW